MQYCNLVDSKGRQVHQETKELLEQKEMMDLQVLQGHHRVHPEAVDRRDLANLEDL